MLSKIDKQQEYVYWLNSQYSYLVDAESKIRKMKQEIRNKIETERAYLGQLMQEGNNVNSNT